MKKFASFSLVFAVLLSFWIVEQAPCQTNADAKSWEVYFSPSGGCTEAVVSVLDRAKSNVLVQAYSFTSAPIAKALVDAKRRGLNVQVILDKSQRTEKYSSADFLRNSGVPTYIDAQHAIAHNKVMVIDAQTVITGSFNFTKAAEDRNAENLLVIQNATLAAKYTANWQAHLQHSEAYQGRAANVQAQPQSESTTASRPVTTQEQPQSVTVYVTRTGKKYHQAGCRYLRGGEIAIDLTKAKAEGYTPCSVCNPPQ